LGSQHLPFPMFYVTLVETPEAHAATTFQLAGFGDGLRMCEGS